MACTTILVGKNASYDGSTIIARNEDSANGEFTAKKFIVVQPEEQPRHYRSVLSHVEIDLPDNPMRYTAVPDAVQVNGIWGEAGVNECNVAMSETETITSNERVLGADPLVELQPAVGNENDENYQPEIPGGIGEEDMLTIVLPYIRSAREGVERLGALLEEYGTYEMNGVAFSDAEEIWWLETIGGHHWIAKRVPDDAYVTMPNQLGIDEFDLEDAFGDQEDHMCSEDLREFIEENHLNLSFDGDNAPINPRDVFGSHSDSDHVYNTPRAWYMQRFLNPYEDEWDGENALYRPDSDNIPWCRTPERKITIEDVKYVLSAHYQGTAYDPYGTLGDAHSRNRFRPIGINRNSQLAVIQLRPYMPEECMALQWIAYGSNAFNTLVPFYANIENTPEYLRDTDGRVTTENFYWINRVIGALADSNFADTTPEIERYRQAVGSFAYTVLHETDMALQQADDADALSADSVTTILESANDRIAQELKNRTETLLDKVLFTASMNMKNGFSLSDN